VQACPHMGAQVRAQPVVDLAVKAEKLDIVMDGDAERRWRFGLLGLVVIDHDGELVPIRRPMPRSIPART